MNQQNIGRRNSDIISYSAELQAILEQECPLCYEYTRHTLDKFRLIADIAWSIWPVGERNKTKANC